MSGLGCYIGHIFAGALCYADDMKLLSPTRKGLIFVKNLEFDVNYNEKKTVAI